MKPDHENPRPTRFGSIGIQMAGLIFHEFVCLSRTQCSFVRLYRKTSTHWMVYDEAHTLEACSSRLYGVSRYRGAIPRCHTAVVKNISGFSLHICRNAIQHYRECTKVRIICTSQKPENSWQTYEINIGIMKGTHGRKKPWRELKYVDPLCTIRFNMLN